MSKHFSFYGAVVRNDVIQHWAHVSKRLRERRFEQHPEPCSTVVQYRGAVLTVPGLRCKGLQPDEEVTDMNRSHARTHARRQSVGQHLSVLHVVCTAGRHRKNGAVCEQTPIDTVRLRSTRWPAKTVLPSSPLAHDFQRVLALRV